MKNCLCRKFFAAFIFCIFFTACKDVVKSDSTQEKTRTKSLDLYLPADLEATLWAESPNVL